MIGRQHTAKISKSLAVASITVKGLVVQGSEGDEGISISISER